MTTNLETNNLENSINAIVFFCYRPPKQIFDFAKKLKSNSYDIYISINDNNYDETPYIDNSIIIIKIDDSIAIQEGYFDSSLVVPNNPCSRDKAFYFFNRINNINYKYIWFIEEDVFIPTINTIKNIDDKYQNIDYLSNVPFFVGNIRENEEHDFVKFNDDYNFHSGWQFRNSEIHKYFKLPWLKTMSCAIRVSQLFLKKIDEFAIKHKKLIMDELLYPTISYHNNLSMFSPLELSNIIWQRHWKFKELRDDYLYHPMKDLILQDKLRKGDKILFLFKNFS
jgi:hypothetical protein